MPDLDVGDRQTGKCSRMQRNAPFTGKPRTWGKRATTHILCVAFALIVQAMQWPAIFEFSHGYPMVDRDVYKYHIESGHLRVDYKFDYLPIEYFTEEWLWNSALRYANDTLGLSPSQIFFFITSFVLWRFSWIIASKVGIAFVPALLYPLVIDLAFSQLRVALAAAILSMFWEGQRGRGMTVIVYVVCLSVHTATILFAFLHLSAYHLSPGKFRNVLLLCGAGFLVSVMVSSWRDVILTAFGDRRAEYVDTAMGPIFGTFWVLLWLVMLWKWKRCMDSFDYRYAIAVLSIVALNTVTGGYSTRFLAAAFPSLVVAMAKWPSRPIGLPFLMFVPFSLIHWMYWLNLR